MGNPLQLNGFELYFARFYCVLFRNPCVILNTRTCYLIYIELIYCLDDIFRHTVHYGLHFLLPGAVAWKLFPGRWRHAWLVMIATMLVDLDHFLADPLFDPNRCGIGFHPLHTHLAMLAYAGMLAFPKLRIIAVGLLLHMAADGIDCVWMASGGRQ